MIPCEVDRWRDKVGRHFRTRRFGSVRFCPYGIATYEMAARDVVPWYNGLIKPAPGCEDQPHYGHPITQDLLKKTADILGGGGVFYSTGFYRPPGLTWGIGAYQDPHGVIDSTDIYGHWRVAIDIARRATAASFGVDVDDLISALSLAGFERPFLRDGEGWHFRPRPDVIRNIEMKKIKEKETKKDRQK